MSLLRNIATGLRSLFQRGHVDRELDEELRIYLEMAAAEKMKQGMSRKEAARAVRLERGNLEVAKEVIRSGGWEFLVETCWRDMRFGLRTLRKSPGFTAVAVLTLALGIGANTAIFSLIDAVLLKSLPVQDPEQLVLLDWVSHGWAEGVLDNISCECTDRETVDRINSAAFSYPIYQQIRDRNHVFSGVAAFAGNSSQLNIGYKGRPSRADGQLVSGTFYSTLGVQPIIGRYLRPDDDEIGASPRAVISYSYWQKRFGGDRSILGQTITVNSVPFTIVGVAPSEFYGVQPGRAVEVWLPLHAPAHVGPGEEAFESRLNWWVLIVGRLKPGVTEQQARSELEGILQQTISSDVRPDTKAETIPHLHVTSASKGLRDLRREFSRPLFILMTVVSLVLLIACANVANLMLARATSRQREIALRLALGGGRGCVARQLLTESVLLATLGGATGLVLAFWVTNLLVAFMASGRETLSLHVAPDLRVLAFTGAASLAAGILFGLSPALRSTAINLTPALKESPGELLSGIGWRGWRLDKVLVVTQVSLSVVLLTGAVQFVRTLTNLKNVSLGFNERNVLLFGIDPTQDGYKGRQVVDFYQGLARRIEALPGVGSVGLSETTAFGGGDSFLRTNVEGYTPKPDGKIEAMGAYYNWVGPKFFETMGIPLILGRTLRESDSEARPNVAVVNQQFVHQFIGVKNPLGRQFSVGSRSGIEIVGVVGDAKFSDLGRETPATAYLSYLQYVGDLNAMHFEVRTAGNPMEMVDPIRRVAHGMDPRLALYDVKSQTQQINQTLFEQRLFARLTGLFATLAGLLASVGIYGVMAFAVTRRGHEIGTRIALGASRHQITRAILRETWFLVGMGIAVGIAMALGTSSLISTMFYGLTSHDPLIFAAASSLMLAAATLAAYIPAHRAATVDPVVALRYE